MIQRPFGISKPEDHTKEEFPPFLLRQAIALRPEYSRVKETPFDLYCPSQRSEMVDKTCKDCEIYLAKKISMKEHRY